MAATGDMTRERMLGIILVLASTAFFALSGVFTKLVSSGPWTIACWRGLVGGLLIAAYVFWRKRPDQSLRLGSRGWALVLVGSLSSVAFIAAFKFTYVANVAVIYATVPFMAALIGWISIAEGVRQRTLVTAAVSLAGVGLMVSGGLSGGSLLGDGFAILMTAGCAIYLVMVRAYHDTPVVWAAAVSAFLLFAFGFVVTDPLAVSARDATLMTTFGVFFALAVVTWTEGARLIPATEAGLLGAAEVPLAVFFAWLLLTELPPVASLAGGAIVLTAVFIHARHDLTATRKAAASLPSKPPQSPARGRGRSRAARRDGCF